MDTKHCRSPPSPGPWFSLLPHSPPHPSFFSKVFWTLRPSQHALVLLLHLFSHSLWMPLSPPTSYSSSDPTCAHDGSPVVPRYCAHSHTYSYQLWITWTLEDFFILVLWILCQSLGHKIELSHLVVCSYIFSNKVWVPGFGREIPFQVCLSSGNFIVLQRISEIFKYYYILQLLICQNLIGFLLNFPD